MENYLRRGIRGARFRLDRRLDRAAVSRAHDVLYLSDAWTEATWLGAQALKNPLDLWVYQEILFETRPELVVETGTYRGGSAAFLASMCDLLGDGEIVSIDIEQVREDYPNHSADHLPRRPLLDRPGCRGRGPGASGGEADARDPRLRPLATARRGRARRLRAARPRRRLPDRRGLQHRADPQGPAPRAPRGDRALHWRRPTSSRSTARARSSSSPSTRAATSAGFASPSDRPPSAVRHSTSRRRRGRGRRPARARGRPPFPSRRAGRRARRPAACRRTPPEWIAGRELERPGGRDVDPLDGKPVRDRALDVGSPVDGRVEELREEERVPLECRLAARVDVELRHRRLGSDTVVDPRPLEASREDEILRRVDDPLPREVRHRHEPDRDGRRQCQARDAAAARGTSPRAARRRRAPSARRAGGRPRPGELRLDPDPERTGNGVDPGLVRELRERQDQRERQRGDSPDRGRDPRVAGDPRRATPRSRRARAARGRSRSGRAAGRSPTECS